MPNRNNFFQASDLSFLTNALLSWYENQGRDLPWRQKGGAHPNPYLVWISEIMLQQTTVKTVIPYFDRWMKKFPTLEAVAKAPLSEILLSWQGLGYYTRAKKIHECAKVLFETYNGQFPNKKEALQKLPGIGPYTSSSLMAFAFNAPETVVDGNVLRVISRLYGITAPVNVKDITPLAIDLTSKTRGADYASAIMDLGATLCTPKNPRCEDCPWKSLCQAHKENLTDIIPLIEKLKKQERKGNVFYIQNEKGEVFIQTRKGKGLLSGLTEFPWNEDESFPFEASFEKKGLVVHTFTHFRLELSVYQTTVKKGEPLPFEGEFVPFERFSDYPFSTLMKKVIKKARK